MDNSSMRQMKIEELEMDNFGNNNLFTNIDFSSTSDSTIDILYAVCETDLFEKLLQIYIQTNRIMTGQPSIKAHEDFWNFSLKIVENCFYADMSQAVMKQFRKSCLKNIKNLKKRWGDTAIISFSLTGDPKMLKKEYEDCKINYIKTGSISIPEINDPDELFEYRAEWFKNWLEPNRYVSEYPYLLEFTEKKISKAFELDLLNCITTVIKDEYNSDIGRIKRANPERLKSGIFMLTTKNKKNSMSLEIVDEEVPIFESEKYSGTNESNNATDLQYNFNASKVSSNKIIATNFTISNSEISEEDLKKLDSHDLMNQIFSKLTLDFTDLKMIRYAVNEAKGQKVRIYIKDLIKELNLSRGAKIYDLLEQKLLKLPAYVIFEYEKTEDGIKKKTFNFFAEVETFTDETGQSYADITFSPSTENVKSTTQKVYAKELKKLKSPQSENLAYFFEGERSRSASKGDNLEVNLYTYSIDTLKLYVHLSKRKSLKQNMDILEIGIKEICDNNFIIKNYKRYKDYFEVSFYPDEERRKNLISSTYVNLPDYIKR